ncbi:MAG: hypothetical protein VYC34_12405, partial [Planctomycetota bacterium]|nr:hypothetical protein [Planctomycetota bacterium]
MIMLEMTKSTSILLASAALIVAGCDRSAEQGNDSSSEETHLHADGIEHTHAGDEDHSPADQDHHDEVSLGAAQIGGMTVELAQGHGGLAPGKEMHLVVKLPYSDNGATVVRAW